MSTGHPLSRITSLSLLTLCLSALTACGGGGGGGDEDPNGNSSVARELRPLGSTGYFVPDGQNSITIPLSNCSARVLLSAGAGGIPPAYGQQAMTDGSLTLYANGDAVLSGAVGSATVATELVRINQSTDAFRQISYRSMNTFTRSGPELSVTYGLNLDDDTQTLDATSSDSATDTLNATSSNFSSYSCDTPVGAFSMPATITNARLALLTAGASGVSAAQLFSADQLTLDNTTTPTSATWHNADGQTFDPLSTGQGGYANSRYVRFDWSGAGGVQGARFLISDSATGTFVAQDMPSRTNTAVEYTGEYTERSNNPNSRRGPGASLAASTEYVASSQPSYTVRVERVGTSTNATIQPVTALNTEAFGFNASLLQANGMPNDFFQHDTDIALSNCTRSTNNGSSSPVQLAVRFISDQRVQWKQAGSSTVLYTYTPSNGTTQARSLSLNTNAGSPTTIRSEFYDTDEAFTINATPGISTIEAAYINADGDSVMDTCDSPSLASTTAATVNNRVTLLLGLNSTITPSFTTASTVLRAFSPGEFDGSATHRFNLDGSIETRASNNTTPGNTDGTFVAWTGGANWILNPTSSYSEHYLRSTVPSVRLQNNTNPELPTGGGSHYFSITLEQGTPTVITLGAN